MRYGILSMSKWGDRGRIKCNHIFSLLFSATSSGYCCKRPINQLKEFVRNFSSLILSLFSVFLSHPDVISFKWMIYYLLLSFVALFQFMHLSKLSNLFINVIFCDRLTRLTVNFSFAFNQTALSICHTQFTLKNR